MTKRRSREKIFYILMTILIAGVIFFSSTIQTTAGEKTGLNTPSLYHFGVFFMFTFFLSLSLIKKRMDNKTILIILLVSLAYALSDELHQAFVPGRFCTLKDILVDLTGSIFSILVIKPLAMMNKLE